jgi:hypothetical protein
MVISVHQVVVPVNGELGGHSPEGMSLKIPCVVQVEDSAHRLGRLRTDGSTVATITTPDIPKPNTVLDEP